ncbi:MAG TPA: SPFH/Band 7/PHB domain protein [Nocardiopsis listeri]|uniref:SPFH domain-containing protein n=1 Tax=Nocardiopsis listeri TaxID=53440 RepID=UPI001D92F9CE|nr:SPFH domain-containing protein [Nocardiopsis listeri]HJE58541.1 SPFH/Band 7/PHB domain protein [Nocardiopsis listeri]
MDPAIPLIIIAVLLVAIALSAIRIVPQARAYNIERFGRYIRTLDPGLNFIIPGVDRVNSKFDLREQVFSSRPQPVITEDNLVVNIDTVLYYQVTQPKAAAYEVANYIQAIDQLTVTTLRNVIGSMDLERTLTSREEINTRLRGVLDETTGKWGIRINRVEIKAIDPPPTIKEAMEKQMRADRDKRAAILHAEGERQSRILKAEGARQQAILEAQGDQQAAILRADGEAKAIEQVFQAVHANDADAKLLAYKYLETLPSLAQGEGNTFWVIPGEFTEAVKNVTHAFAGDAAKTTPSTEKGQEEEKDTGPAQITGPDPARSASSQAAAQAAEAAEKAVADARDDVRRAGANMGSTPSPRKQE